MTNQRVANGHPIFLQASSFEVACQLEVPAVETTSPITLTDLNNEICPLAPCDFRYYSYSFFLSDVSGLVRAISQSYHRCILEAVHHAHDSFPTDWVMPIPPLITV